jgi:phytoene dehydrogenase-like protein
MAGTIYDVIVIGAGNAGLTAALAARQQETRVLLLDKCPKAARGGNTRFSGGGFRFTYNNLDDMRPMLPSLTNEEAAKMEVGTYSRAEFFEDVMQVTEYAADKRLTRILVDQSYATARWLTDMNVKWILSTSTHAVKMGGKIKFPSGRVISVNDGGLGLVEMLFPTAEKNGIEIIYEAKATALSVDARGKVSGVRVQAAQGLVDFQSRAVVLAAGGFEANPEMRARYLGTGWDLVKVRGSRYNTGEVLNLALGFGAQPIGHWSGCHAVLVDAEAPDVECAYEHRYSYPYGIMVDINGGASSMKARIFSATPTRSAAGKCCACHGARPIRFSTAKPARCCAPSTTAAFTSAPTASKRWRKSCRAWIGRTSSRRWMRSTTRSTTRRSTPPSTTANARVASARQSRTGRSAWTPRRITPSR